jgi:hypothetical protein
MYINGSIWMYCVSFFLDVDVDWTCELVQVLAPTNSRSHSYGTMSPTWRGCDKNTHPTKANVHCPIPRWVLSNHQTFRWSNHEGENRGEHKLYPLEPIVTMIGLINIKVIHPAQWIEKFTNIYACIHWWKHSLWAWQHASSSSLPIEALVVSCNLGHSKLNLAKEKMECLTLAFEWEELD